SSGDQVGRSHELIETAKRFEAATAIGNDACCRANRDAGELARASCRQRWPQRLVVTVVDRAIDAIKDHAQLGLILCGETRLLKMRWRVCSSAVLQIEKD